MSLSPRAVAKRKIMKMTKGKESGTSSEEERWLDAIESGKLEEVDDELKKIKPKDPKLMTARQRAMFERKTDAEPNSNIEQLMSLPLGYKEKVLTAEAIQKAALKSQKRKQLADEKREKDKKKTMERLLKKQETKTSKIVPKTKTTARHQVPIITYRSTPEGSTISIPLNEVFPLLSSKVWVLLHFLLLLQVLQVLINNLIQTFRQKTPEPVICGVSPCTNQKKYCCSKTGIPLCSLACYRANLLGFMS
ncbi:hypothetical protein QAD02_015902 [Eretmocerus hayati]|uniref:Uncharacterized protein n=1 Tax=Eretmocerus hayati TaxID=131215 RepID=A0ACC2PEB4_9HYME|nr:hypothetical protein QAD02_015902 [Eretmocerus hayati]